MKKEEFTKLWYAKDDISSKKVQNILNNFCMTSQNEEVHSCLDTMETLTKLKEYKDKVKEVSPEIVEEPFTVDNAIQLLQYRIVDILIDTLED